MCCFFQCCQDSEAVQYEIPSPHLQTSTPFHSLFPHSFSDVLTEHYLTCAKQSTSGSGVLQSHTLEVLCSAGVCKGGTPGAPSRRGTLPQLSESPSLKLMEIF